MTKRFYIVGETQDGDCGTESDWTLCQTRRAAETAVRRLAKSSSAVYARYHVYDAATGRFVLTRDVRNAA